VHIQIHALLDQAQVLAGFLDASIQTARALMNKPPLLSQTRLSVVLQKTDSDKKRGSMKMSVDAKQMPVLKELCDAENFESSSSGEMSTVGRDRDTVQDELFAPHY
jgi:hypothetical protein